MKVAIMQPYIFPYIGYFQLINAVDKFVIYDDVTFIKQGWINRNNILLNKKPFLFTVPVKDISSFTLIKDTEISWAGNWKAKFLKTITQAYSKAPFYDHSYKLIADVFSEHETRISRLAIQSIKVILNYLEIKTTVIESSFSSYQNSYLNYEERILDICKRELATHYLNPIGGISLYSKETFQASKIELCFLKTKPILYQQFGAEFVPSLSIIDVIMFNSKEEIKEMLKDFHFV
jgi:hypothetical protein